MFPLRPDPLFSSLASYRCSVVFQDALILNASTGGNAFRADANWYIAFFGDNRIETTVFTETDRSKSSLGGDGVVNGLSLLTFQMLNSPTLRLKR